MRRFATGSLRQRLRAKRDARVEKRPHSLVIVATLLGLASLAPAIGLGTVGQLARGETALFSAGEKFRSNDGAGTYGQTVIGSHGRNIMSATTTCTEDTGWTTSPSANTFLYTVGTLYLFLGVAIVCDDFFTDSLEVICEKLNLSEDVAGATLMAAGSSAPELFTSTMSLVSTNATNELGVATIVGSAVFNILVIVALVTIFSINPSRKKLKLDWKPVTRDCFFYAIAITSLLLVMSDGRVYWWEGVVCVCLYGGYVLFMSRNEVIMKKVDAIFERNNISPIDDDVEKNTIEDVHAVPSVVQLSPKYTDRLGDSDPDDPYASVVRVEVVKEGECVEEPNETGVTGKTSEKTNSKPAGQSQAVVEKFHSTVDTGPTESDDSDDNDSDPFTKPEHLRDFPLWAISLPWYAAFRVSIPDAKGDSKIFKKKNYLVSFFMSVFWISLISHGMVDLASRLGCVLDIPEVVMGTVVLAAGTSVPDALASISVAQSGAGDMAVANAVGSNVFDILLGLGLPWSILLPFRHTGYELVNNTQLAPSICILGFVLLVYYSSIAAAKFTLHKKQAFVFLTLYLAFVAYAIVGVWWMDMYDIKK
ncbi:calcium/sodium antiporter [bacterium]|nr:calcium/sodium antiporter [bacterium]